MGDPLGEGGGGLSIPPMPQSLKPSRQNTNLRLRHAIADLGNATHIPLTQLTASIAVVIAEALLMEKALAFYAEPENYLDDVPMLGDGEGGLEEEDCGLTAQRALHLCDGIGDPVIIIEQQNMTPALEQQLEPDDADESKPH